jgi:hypothetical protein
MKAWTSVLIRSSGDSSVFSRMPHKSSVVWRHSSLCSRNRIEEGGDLLAENILLDRTAAEWNRMLARLSAQAGELRRVDVEANHALSTRLALICEQGTIRGELILTGELKPHIQALILEAAPAA